MKPLSDFKEKKIHLQIKSHVYPATVWPLVYIEVRVLEFWSSTIHLGYNSDVIFWSVILNPHKVTFVHTDLFMGREAELANTALEGY